MNLTSTSIINQNMGVIMTKTKERSSIILYALILFFVSIIPTIGKSLFVSPTGNIKIIGPEIGFFLSVGIYLKWKYIDRIFYLILIPLIIIEIIWLFIKEDEFSFNFVLLFACHLALLIIFRYSRYIQNYLKSGYQY